MFLRIYEIFDPPVSFVSFLSLLPLRVFACVRMCARVCVQNCDLDELVKHALKALSGCVTGDKELDAQGLTLAIVGKVSTPTGSRLHTSLPLDYLVRNCPCCCCLHLSHAPKVIPKTKPVVTHYAW